MKLIHTHNGAFAKVGDEVRSPGGKGSHSLAFWQVPSDDLPQGVVKVTTEQGERIAHPVVYGLKFVSVD